MEKLRLDSLNIACKEPRSINKSYSFFVKVMRYLLPLSAVVLISLAFIWPQLKEDLVIMDKADLGISRDVTVGQTELLKPNFETLDSNNNPIKVQATKASQDQINPKLIQLEEPNADLLLKDGAALNVQSDIGTYEQETEKLYLQENVSIVHEEGYVLTGEELRLNMETQEAFSDKAITITDDKTKIEAVGVEGDMKAGILTFKGPAKMTWYPKEDKQEPQQEPIEKLGEEGVHDNETP